MKRYNPSIPPFDRPHLGDGDFRNGVVVFHLRVNSLVGCESSYPSFVIFYTRRYSAH